MTCSFRKGNPPASKDEVSKLKTVKYKKKEGSTPEECSVCKMDFDDGDDVKIMPCEHQYHIECIDKWLEMSNFCPLCRYELKTDDDDYEKSKKQNNNNSNSNE